MYVVENGYDFKRDGHDQIHKIFFDSKNNEEKLSLNILKVSRSTFELKVDLK